MEAMENRFNEKLLSVMRKKRPNSGFLPRKKYCQMIDKVKESKSKTSGKKPEDYQRLKRYDIMKIDNSERLVFPMKNDSSSVRYYVQLEEIFYILHETHLSLGHGRRTKMLKELQKKFKNITREQIMIYLSLCDTCRKGSNPFKKEQVQRPVSPKDMNSSCYLGFIDMQNDPDHEYRYILVFQDQTTKFIQLRPLKSKQPLEVANILVDIFTIFGFPRILNCDNGQEFCDQVIKEARNIWSDLNIVSGELRQSSKLDTQTHQDIRKMLKTWLESNRSSRWVDGLRFIQYKKNNITNSDVNSTPFEAIFHSRGNAFAPPRQRMEPKEDGKKMEELHKLQMNKMGVEVLNNVDPDDKYTFTSNSAEKRAEDATALGNCQMQKTKRTFPKIKLGKSSSNRKNDLKRSPLAFVDYDNGEEMSFCPDGMVEVVMSSDAL